MKIIVSYKQFFQTLAFLFMQVIEGKEIQNEEKKDEQVIKLIHITQGQGIKLYKLTKRIDGDESSSG